MVASLNSFDRADRSASADPLRLVVVGAAPDTGNLGVSALGESIIHTIAQLDPAAQVTVFDNGTGSGTIRLADQQVVRQGLRHSRRIYQRSSLLHARLSMTMGAWRSSPILQAICGADAALDITGGDSFSDIYGERRFRQSLGTKHLVLRCGTPLVLMPQTYGPFASPANAERAASVVRQAAMAWARDTDSFAVLRDLAKGSATPLDCGVDVAVQLPALDPGAKLDARICRWARDTDHDLVGINISGLLLNRPEQSRSQYGLSGDYESIITRLLERLLNRTHANIALIPHVCTPESHYESDVAACREFARRYGDSGRVAVGPATASASQVKWVISQCDWFCGTRMHSTIAALSTATPAAAIAYSPKTRGVFASFGVADHVADLRSLQTDQMVSHLWQSFADRRQAAAVLDRRAPEVRRAAVAQMRRVLARCRELAGRQMYREAMPA